MPRTCLKLSRAEAAVLLARQGWTDGCIFSKSVTLPSASISRISSNLWISCVSCLAIRCHSPYTWYSVLFRTLVISVANRSQHMVIQERQNLAYLIYLLLEWHTHAKHEQKRSNPCSLSNQRQQNTRQNKYINLYSTTEYRGRQGDTAPLTAIIMDKKTAWRPYISRRTGTTKATSCQQKRTCMLRSPSTKFIIPRVSP